MSKSVQEIEQAAIARIAMLIGEFSGMFAARVVCGDTGALDGIEGDWAGLNAETEKIYQQMVSELTDAIDERDMIAKKNGVGQTGDQAENRQVGRNQRIDDAGEGRL
jgi:hypothetical protein